MEQALSIARHAPGGTYDKALLRHINWAKEHDGKIHRPAFPLVHLKFTQDKTACGWRYAAMDMAMDNFTDLVPEINCTNCLQVAILAVPVRDVTPEEIAEAFGDPHLLLPIPVTTPVQTFVMEVQRVVDDYRTVYPLPHALAANLQLLARACELLGHPLTRGT